MNSAHVLLRQAQCLTLQWLCSAMSHHHHHHSSSLSSSSSNDIDILGPMLWPLRCDCHGIWHNHPIPYHPGHRGRDLPRTTLRPIKMAQCASLDRIGRTSLQVYSVYRCRWCAATATFLLAVHSFKCWVSLRPCTAYSAGAGTISRSGHH